jgi:16S rRNA (adenine1518-N6/adenine1519-N6)-dimethyltransferase
MKRRASVLDAHGQNFLIDLNLLDLLVRTADVGASDVVLEVGTGMGSLTARLAPLAAAVVTVEIAPRLFVMASEELASFSNVTMLQQDALKSKQDSPGGEAVNEVAAVPGGRLKLPPFAVQRGHALLSNLLTIEPVPVPTR